MLLTKVYYVFRHFWLRWGKVITIEMEGKCYDNDGDGSEHIKKWRQVIEVREEPRGLSFSLKQSINSYSQTYAHEQHGEQNRYCWCVSQWICKKKKIFSDLWIIKKKIIWLQYQSQKYWPSFKPSDQIRLTNSFYTWLQYGGIPNRDYSSIWKFKIPHKIKIFLYLVRKNNFFY